MDDLKEKLKLAECPFNWGLREIKDRKPATFVIDRLLEKEEEISEPWVHICINLTIAYLHSENGDISKAITVLKECDSILNTSSYNLIVKYKPAFQSVYNASRASLLMFSSTPFEVKMFLDKVVGVEDLDVPNQAAVCAIKANVFLEFGVTGSTIALQHAKEALKKNGKEADWHFLMGKLLSRLRHFTQDHDISPAEISHLQTAFNLAGTPRSAIFLANAYIEKSRSLNSELYNGNRPYNDVRNEIKKLATEAKKLIKLALDKNQNQCVHILIRCAFAYAKLPRFDRECETAKQLLEESLKRSPCNPMANKLAGDLCLQEDKPMYHKALKHFEIAASRNVYSANFAAFDIQVKLSLNPDVESFYAKMLVQFTENNYQMLTFIHATEYYLFIRRDLCAAVNYFMKAIELDPNFHALTDRWVKCIQKNVNLYELIFNEVRHSINSQIFHDTNQLNLLRNASQKIAEINPKLMGVPIVPNKVQVYLDTYERESKNVTGRGRGRGRGRGQGRGGRGRGRGGGGEAQLGRNVGSNSVNRGSGRTNNGERRGFGPRSRSSSRNRFGQNKNENEVLKSNENQNYHQSKFDQSQFNRLSYEHDKSAEVLENPYYVKFLELRYKKMTKSESFKEWLQEYEVTPSSNVRSNNASKKEKSDGKSDAKIQDSGNSDAKFQELISVINQLKEEIDEIKLSETRSCCSSALYRRERCHSLKSLEYNEYDKSRKPEEYYRRKHRADYLSHDRYMDPRDRYFSSRRLEDRYRWRSEDRNAKYDRKLSSHREKDKYGYYISPEREIRRRPSYDSDSDSDSEPRYHSSHDQKIERRSRKSSFSERRMDRKSSRQSSPSPTYNRRMERNSPRRSSPTYTRRTDRNSSRHSSPTFNDRKYLTSSHRHRSEDRRVRSEYLQRLENSISSSNETDSQFYQSPREEKSRRPGSIDSESLGYRRNLVPKSEKGDKHPKHRKTENQQCFRRLNEEQLKRESKSVKKEVLSTSSSKSSSDEDRDLRKGANDEDSDREPCLGYGKVKHSHIGKDNSVHRYKDNDECSSSESLEKSVSKKSHLKSKDKLKRDLEIDKISERGYKNKNHEIYHENYNDKYSSSESRKYQSADSKGHQKYEERSELASRVDTKKNMSKSSNVDRISSSKEYRSEEALKMVRKNHDTDKSFKEHSRDEYSRKDVRKSSEPDKSETYSRKSSNVKDNTYSQFDPSIKQTSSRKGTSMSRSSSEWENIGHQDIGQKDTRSETNRSDRENRCSKPLSDDEYEKTSSG